MVLVTDRLWRGRLLHLGHVVGHHPVRMLCRSVCLDVRRALARNGAWHSLQDRLDEQCGLRDCVIYGVARGDGVALEPHTAPQRHHHNRARSGNRGAAPAGSSGGPWRIHQPEGCPKIFPHSLHTRAGPADAGRVNLYPSVRAQQSHLAGADLCADICCSNRDGNLYAQRAAAPIHRAAQFIWGLVVGDIWLYPTCRAGRERARPPAQLPHRVHEPD